MKTNDFLNYEAPQAEVLNVEVEQGFTVSDDSIEYPLWGDENPL